MKHRVTRAWRTSTLLVVAAALVLIGAVPAQAAAPVRINCDKAGCLLGLQAVSSWSGNAKLRVDAFARPWDTKPSTRRVRSGAHRTGTAWIYRTRTGWEMVTIHDMRVRVAPAPWSGWSKVRPIHGTRWLYVQSDEHAVEMSCQRADSIEPTTGQRCSRIVVHDLWQGGIHNCDCVTHEQRGLPVMSREDLLAGKGQVVTNTVVDSSWTRVVSEVSRFDGGVCGQEPRDQQPRMGWCYSVVPDPSTLICTMSLVRGYRYQNTNELSDVITDEQGHPLTVEVEGSISPLVLENRAHDAADVESIVVRCGITEAPADGGYTEIERSFSPVMTELPPVP